MKLFIIFCSLGVFASVSEAFPQLISESYSKSLALSYTYTSQADKDKPQRLHFRAYKRENYTDSEVHMTATDTSYTYTVQDGDTGNKIAAEENISFATLEALNPGINWYNLQIGQVLRIAEQPGTYIVVSGDEGLAIAAHENMTFATLEALNPGVNWNNLQIGEELQIAATTANTDNTTIPSQPIPFTAAVTPLQTSATTSTFLNTPTNITAKTSGRTNLSQASISTMTIPDILTCTAYPSGSITNLGDPGTNGNPTVKQYSGPASNFPDASEWQRFSLMWAAAVAVMSTPDTPEQIEYIKEAIEQVAEESGVDRRVILCVMMQESGGNVYVRTTYSPGRGSHANPGLMQSYNGVTFDPENQRASILQMIKDGILGTASGDGLLQNIESNNGNVYEGLRAYNSGSVNVENLSMSFGSTSDYVSMIANRLMGADPN